MLYLYYNKSVVMFLMKIKIIGTGSIWTNLNSACYLIDDEIMIDFPNGACKYLYREKIIPSSINYILLTHFHGDHYFDIPFYILNKAKSDNKKCIIFCSKDGKSKIKRLGKLAFPNSFNNSLKEINIKYNYNYNFNINNYKVDKLLVEHGRMKPSFGYIFNDNNKYIGFTGDTCLCSNVELMAQKCCYLFCDCMLLIGNNKHQGINDLEYLSKKYPECIFVVSHLENETKEKLKTKKIKNIKILEDGSVIKIN